MGDSSEQKPLLNPTGNIMNRIMRAAAYITILEEFLFANIDILVYETEAARASTVEISN